VIHVALADDQTLVRQGIRSLLELTADIRVAAEASDGEEALATLSSTAIDVALLDVRMPKKTGLEVLAARASSRSSASATGRAPCCGRSSSACCRLPRPCLS
jgi:YesN/AraC family two-component response regulator